MYGINIYCAKMKVLISLAALVTIVACNAIPSIPLDNSHYVEGESRYVWMPDGEGKLVLVDLEEPVDHELLSQRNGANNQYWLFTRSNRNNPQVLVNGNVNSVVNSNFRNNEHLTVIVHGWNNNGNTAMNPLITAAFLDSRNMNVIVVDWRALANGGYNTAVNGVPSVGQHIGNFLVWLVGITNTNWNNVHLIGFSLGAHVVGVAGRQAGGRPARVTGLDPAGPSWNNNSNRLNAQSGVYVECIHTEGSVLGIFNNIGNADFYPNGGRNQPGCMATGIACSHGRATELFAATVRFNHLVGRSCPNLSTAQLSTCSGSTLQMGNGNVNKRGSGIYGLITGSSWPY